MENNNLLVDYFTNNNTGYLYFNPSYFYNIDKSEIVITDIDNNCLDYKIKKTNNNCFNIVYFIEIYNFNFDNEIKICILKYNYKKICVLNNYIHDDVFLQSIILMKDEYYNIPNFIDYYKNKHEIDRFIIFDNNSTNLLERQKFKEYVENRNDVIYVEFNMPYSFTHSFIDTSCRSPFFIIAQNTCYSLSLKKYNSIWSMLLDLDEYIIFNNTSLKKKLLQLDVSIESVKINGYWAGCNGMTKYNFNPSNVKKRSNKICGPKHILKNKSNDFTIDIHWVKNNKQYELDIFDNYFFHFKTLSNKGRVCDCSVDCSIDCALYKMLNI